MAIDFVGTVREAVRPRMARKTHWVAHQDTVPTGMTVNYDKCIAEECSLLLSLFSK